MQIDAILQYALKRTHFKARQMVGIAGLTEGDLHNVRQELLADLIHRLPHYDGSRAGLKTFVSRIIDNCRARIIERREAPSRSYHREQGSLDNWTHDEDGLWVRVGEMLTEDEAVAPLGIFRRSAEEQSDLAHDTAAILARLPEELRELAVRLQTQSVAEIAREMGLSRTTVYQWIERLRTVFFEAGMKNYL
jgi:RNA polymerase sigma-70 factor (ECF subfamily)